ncbi:CHASE4 domain-containing protein, partial [Magnetococcales bacterium HHB-1]
MTLRRLTFIVFSLALITLMASLFFSGWSFYVKLTEQHARQNLKQAQGAIHSELSALAVLVNNWAERDSTYEFMENHNTEYIDSRIMDETFSSLQLNLLAFFDLQGNMVIGEFFDTETGESSLLPQSLRAHFRPQGALYIPILKKNGLTGLLSYGRRTLFLATHPILTSTGDGPNLGTLVMGRFFTSERKQHMEQRSGLALTLHPQSMAKKLPKDFQKIRPFLSEEKPEHITPHGRFAMSGYALLTDILKQPQLILRVDSNTALTQQRQSSLRQFFISILLFPIIFGTLLYYLITKFVLSRLSLLSEIVQRIGMAHNFSVRIPVDKKDEIGNLGHAINHMLSELEQVHHQLKIAHNTMEQRVTERTSELSTVNRELKQEIVERKRVETALYHREELLEQIALASRHFLKKSRWEDNIQTILQGLGETLTTHRVLLFRYQRSEKKENELYLLHYWINPEYPLKNLTHYQPMKQAQFGKETLKILFKQGQPLHGTPSQFSAPLQPFLYRHQIQSAIFVPVFQKERGWGVLAFFDYNNQRAWSESERGAVLAVADVLSAAIERTHNEERILHSREQLRQLSFHIHSVREEEKKRIAGEIHDELGSILTKLKMDLVSLTRNTNNPQEQIR